jgi:hypothetical protein
VILDTTSPSRTHGWRVDELYLQTASGPVRFRNKIQIWGAARLDRLLLYPSVPLPYSIRTKVHRSCEARRGLYDCELPS